MPAHCQTPTPQCHSSPRLTPLANARTRRLLLRLRALRLDSVRGTAAAAMVFCLAIALHGGRQGPLSSSSSTTSSAHSSDQHQQVPLHAPPHLSLPPPTRPRHAGDSSSSSSSPQAIAAPAPSSDRNADAPLPPPPPPAPAAAPGVVQPGRHTPQQRQPGGKAPQQQQPWLGAALDVAGYSKRGWMLGGGKVHNQDRGLILESFRDPSELCVGVFDGHGTFGHQVSALLAQRLPCVLMQQIAGAAAAAVGTGVAGSSNSSSDSSSGGGGGGKLQLFGRVAAAGGKQLKQQQHQEQLFSLDGDHAWLVIPDNTPRYYGHTAAVATSSRSSSSSELAQHHGRPVLKQQIVRAPPHPDLSSSSSSGGSSSAGVKVPPQSELARVPLSQALLGRAFVAADGLLAASGINVTDSGSTAVLCHIGPHTVSTAWVGDSRAVLGRLAPIMQQQQPSGVAGVLGGWRQQLAVLTGRGDASLSADPPQQQPRQWQAVPLSDDHKPERPDERRRIEAAGGRVEQMFGRGPYRVWFQGLDYPGLAMSRAFGDLPCKRIGVTAEPEFQVTPLTLADRVLVAASDGVWDVMTNEEVVELAGAASSASAAARSLVEVAEARWEDLDAGDYCDDLTAVVVLAKLPAPPRV